MEEDFIAKEEKEDLMRERPEMPEDVEIEDNSSEINSIDGMKGGNYFRPGIVYPSREQETLDPMLPLIYFSTGVFSTLLAFIVFYVCFRHFHNHKNCEPRNQLADKKD